jgi:hypothetical protein
VTWAVIILTAESAVVLDAHTVVSVVEVGVFSAVVAIAVLWTVAFIVHTVGVAISGKQAAVITFPVIFAHTRGMIIFIGCMLDTFVAIASAWAVTAFGADWVAWGVEIVTRISFPELVADTFIAVVRIHMGVFGAFIAVTGIRAETVDGVLIGFTAPWVTWCVIGVAIVTVESFATLTVPVEVSLRVVVALKTILAGWSGTSVTVVANWVA